MARNLILTEPLRVQKRDVRRVQECVLVFTVRKSANPNADRHREIRSRILEGDKSVLADRMNELLSGCQSLFC